MERKRRAELDEQRRKNNRLRLTVVGVSVLLVGAIIAGVYAYGKQKQAQAAEQQAKAALNFVFLQRANTAQSTGQRYHEYGENTLAKKSYKVALSLLDSLPASPAFPQQEMTAFTDFERLKKDLDSLITNGK